MIRQCLVCLSVTGLVAIIGCNPPAEPEGPTVDRVAAQNPDEFNRLWAATEETLIENYFELDRQDRLAGVITTYPETTAAGFELWRPQPQDPYLWWEANLHTIQRRATVTLQPIETPGDYEVGVRVDRYQYSMEERQIDNPAGARRMFSSQAPTETRGEMAMPGETSHFIALGRDPMREEELLSGIIQRYRKRLAEPVIQTTPEPVESEPGDEQASQME
jgi:hypothetical protein